jgi:hypothetical protein
MPVRLGYDSIEILYPDTNTTYNVDTVKSSGYRDGDTIVNVPVVPLPQVVSSPNVSSETIDADYKYMAFTHSGGSEDQTEYSLNFNIETECDILIVGGGGGGANASGGGGGGGGVILAESIILNGMYNIKVGKGGDGVSTDNGNNGKNSELEGIIALGGGGGRGWIAEVGHDGGSGGGGGANNGSSPNTNGSSTQSKDKTTYGFLYTLTENGARLNIYGEDGGDGGINSASSDLYDALGGGGGGANQVGYSGTSSNGANAGKGGDGINLSHIFGNTVGENGYFAGGGGGGSDGNIPTGLPGLGGGGQGYGQVNTPNINGKPNTGGGGGGAYRATLSGSGGSGIVIIRYKVTDATMVPKTINEDPNYKLLTFTYDETLKDYPVIDSDAANLVAWYKFDGDFKDSSGNGYDLTNHSSSTQSTHVIDGEAVEFDNTDYLEFPSTINPYTIWNGNGITFSFWVRFTAHETWARLIDFQGGTSENTGILFSVNSSTNALFLRINTTQFQYSDLSNSLITNLNVWNHIVFSIDTSGNWNVYSNNTRINNAENENIPNKTYNIRYINKSAYSADGQWEGQMDNFRIYDKALSATEISDLYNQYNQTSYTVNFPAETECDILIVGGGGAGGGNSGDGGNENGGGGGGGVLYMVNKKLNGEYKFIVGNGGINSGYDGSDSKIIKNDQVVSYDSIQLIGYGGGGGGSGNTHSQGTYGRSGGSAGGNNFGQTAYTSTATQGNTIWNGTSYIAGGYVGNTRGTGGSHGNTGGGGGGAGGSPIGVNNGGIGVEIDITGVPTYYAGGGGSAGSGVDGVGGLGGGGDPNASSTDSSLPENGESHTGGGGGGAYTNLTLKKKGGNGGSGIVIIRYKTQYNQVPFNAQWTYSTTDTSVHHYGNVGIGTLASDTTLLTIKGDMNILGNYYRNDVLLTEKWLSSGNNIDIYRDKGFVGIGTNDVQYGMHVEGQLYANSGGITGDDSTTWTVISDSRIKQNVIPASGQKCVENVRNINLYRFAYDTNYVDTNDKNQLGFIAQEVQQFYPKAVKKRDMGFTNNFKIPDLMTVDVTQINYTLYGAVKKLAEDIDTIREKLGITENQIDIKNKNYIRKEGEEISDLIIS